MSGQRSLVLDGATTGGKDGFVWLTIKTDMDGIAAPHLGGIEVGVLTIVIVAGRRRRPLIGRH